jgi:hypothetical protein
MKTITNKQTQIATRLDSTGAPVFATYGDLLLITINMAPEQGFSITDIRTRLKIAGEIESGKGGDMSFEDSEITVLKIAFDKFKWTAVHQDLVDLSDILNTL